MRKYFLIARFSATSAPARRGGPAPRLTDLDSRIAPPFLFDTNKPNKIKILLRALLKTMEKQFSIQYKFAVGCTGNLACPERTRRACASRSWRFGVANQEIGVPRNARCADDDSRFTSRRSRATRLIVARPGALRSRRMQQRLHHHAVLLGFLAQRGDLLRRGVRGG